MDKTKLHDIFPFAQFAEKLLYPATKINIEGKTEHNTTTWLFLTTFLLDIWEIRLGSASWF
jgi:hypothetical protein